MKLIDVETVYGTFAPNVRLHGKPQTMLTDDAVYIVENGYTL